MASPSILIVGSGFGGIGTAIELQRAGFTDFTILEKAAEVGGVWRENTYPGAGCDIPSPLYSFSYEPNPDWPKRYSLQPDIHAYLKRVVEKYGLAKHIRFGTEVTSATFDEDTRRWRIETSTGETHEANVFVPAVGQLSRPVWPDIPGRESFKGTSFHSALWDHDCDLTGKKVAVIGTGASAIQFVPEIQPLAHTLTLFQRTAPYIMNKTDTRYRRWQQRLFRALPATQLIGRLRIWLLAEYATYAMTKNPLLAKGFELRTEQLRRRHIKDPVLRAKLKPHYDMGCKRILFTNDYLPAIARPNVHVETAKITEITERGIRTEDGVEHEADVIIYGTGFAATDFLGKLKVHGLGGRSLSDSWAGGARAYLGMTVPGFPNLFCVYGPNTNLGAGSIIYMIERQARYIRQAVEHLARPDVSYVDVKADVEERYDTEVQQRLARSVWTKCASWYRQDDGRVTTNWPGLVSEYDRRTRKLDLREYHTVA
ncbi:Predicted flavoprotein CzcO associated with the cation diffusion facilitator CzcD [Amycolatopsis xylanica]|uniref:Predicted flavoprotein CzcO associated with the cation diffusion facilitator CzcD n=1 Tax=Amycolatopsis xylanica TaxID=589385 RepID=A0A1H3NBG9_9PSEU|nr:NAD(P)/FAD-dependent oxidoreductase [Amycolatopsis xylanica]SDY85825.1 Predicted flavoprotein CzcO associated with the cation diffusion facilitator CzcD [Amycolatopsis xylanica]